MVSTDTRLDVRAAALYVALVVLLWSAGWSIAGDLALTSPGPRTVSLVLLLVAATATLWRKRRPGLVLTVTGLGSASAMFLPSGLGAVFLQFEAVFTAVLFGSRALARFATGLCIAVTATVGILALMIPHSDASVWFALVLQTAVVLLIPPLWAWEVRHHRQARAEAENAARTQKELTAREHDLAQARAALAVQEHRGRLAQDLHDGVAGHLSAVALQAAALRTEGMRNAPEATRDSVLESIRTASVDALTEMRTLIDVLRDQAPADLHLDPHRATEDLEARLRASFPAASVTVESGAVDLLTQASPEAAETVIRVAQETVTNILKHAGPGAVEFRLAVTQDNLELTASSPMDSQIGGSEPFDSDRYGSDRYGSDRHGSVRTDSAQGGSSHGDANLAGACTVGSEPSELTSGVGLRSMALRTQDLGGSFHAGPAETGRLWMVKAQWPLAVLQSRAPGEPSQGVHHLAGQQPNVSNHVTGR